MELGWPGRAGWAGKIAVGLGWGELGRGVWELEWVWVLVEEESR